MYTILTSKFKDVEDQINVDLIRELQHPKSILIGGGSLVVKYTNYLEKEIFNDINLLRRFVSINKIGNEKGTIALVCNCKLGKQDNRKAHSEIIKEFLIKYTNEFTKLLPYLFNNQGGENKSDEEIEQDISILSDTLKITLLNNINTTKMLSGASIKNLEKLSDTDKEQIKDLLLQRIDNEEIRENIKSSSFDDLINTNKNDDVIYEEPSIIEGSVEAKDQDVSLNKDTEESPIKVTKFGSLPPDEIKDRGNISNVIHKDENPFYEGSLSKE